jgi:hypothetical protein
MSEFNECRRYQQAIGQSDWPEPRIICIGHNLNRFCRSGSAFRSRRLNRSASVMNNPRRRDKTGNTADAITHYQQAIKLDPKYAKALTD